MVVATVLVAFAGHASADDVTEARDHYKKGTKAFELGAFDEAVAEYDSAGNVSIPSGSTYGMFSSAKYKKDIHFLDQMDLEKALKLLLDTPVATFRNKAAPPETKVAYGVIAEKTPSPLLTQENDAFSMSNAVGVLMASVKAQQAHIAELEARLAKLEGRKQHTSRTKATAPAIPRAPAE